MDGSIAAQEIIGEIEVRILFTAGVGSVKRT